MYRRPTKRLQRTSCRRLLPLAPRSARGTKPLNRGPLGRRGGCTLERKPVVRILVGVIAFFAGAYALRHVTDWFRREPQLAAELQRRSWVEQPLGTSGIALTVPWRLEPQLLQLPPEIGRVVASSTSLSHEAEGLNVTALHISFLHGTPTNLEGAADGAIAKLRTVPGTELANVSKSETSVLEGPGIEIEARIERERGVPLRMRGIIFGNGPEFYQVLVVYRDDQTSGDGLWKRLRSGIHRKTA